MMSESLQLGFRTGKYISLFNACPEYSAQAGLEKIEVTSRMSCYSPDGRYFAWGSPTCVTITNTQSGETVCTLPRPQAIQIDFSPKGTYISVYQNWTRDDQNNPTKNITLWQVEDGASGDEKVPLSAFHMPTPDCWRFQFSADESICARMVSTGIDFFQAPDFRTSWKKCRVDGIGGFELAPSSLSLAVYVPIRKGKEGSVKVFRKFAFEQPVSHRTIFKGDRFKLTWNPAGTCVLALATTDVDAKNMSYYGEHNLFVLHSQHDLCAQVKFDKTGPIHDVQWSPTSKSFAVVYGFMPASVTIFNLRAEISHNFENPGSRNTILFSPQGRFLLVAGFGNLSGQMDIYDLERDYEKVSTIDGNIATVCSWAPDGQHILTATTSPRMVVDNRIRIWHVSGNVMYNREVDDLLSVSWRPRDPSQFPLGNWKVPPPADSSAQAYLATVKKPVKTGVYRPPGAASASYSAGASARASGNGGASKGKYIPGAEPAEQDEGKSTKSKRRREKKVHSEAESPAEAGAPQLQIDGRPVHANEINRSGRPSDRKARKDDSASTSRRRPNKANGGSAAEEAKDKDKDIGGVPLAAAEPNSEAIPNRRARTLLKKLREIDQLKLRQAGGEDLEVTQLKKISSEDVFRKELNSLGYDESADIGI